MFWHRRTNRDHDLERELRSHLDLEAEEQRNESGFSADQARQSAQRALGNTTRLKEDVRETWGFAWLERFAQDIGYGIRTLRKSPAFTVIAAGTLALAIGANTAIFSVIEAVLLRPLPYRDPSRLVLLSDPQNPDDDGILYGDFENWRSHSRSFTDMAIYYRDSGWSQVTLTGSSDEPQTAQGAFVSANFFSVLGVSPVLGRSFTTDEVDQHARVVLLSHELWTDRFGNSPDVVGQALRVDGVNCKVIGVMPAEFKYPGADSAFWAPITTDPHWDDPALLGTDPNKSRGFYARWQAVARLRSGISPRSAQNELNSVAKHLQEISPDVHRASGIAVIPLRVHVTGDTRLALALLFAAVCLVLLIACANVSNLVLARGATRQRELSLRSALGASRLRILRQLFTENLILAIYSASLGMLFAPVGIRALIVIAPPGIPRLSETRIDGRVLIFTLSVAILSAIVFGILPAWKASLSDPAESIKGGTGTGAGATRVQKLQRSLAVAEFALALILLAGAGLLLRSFFIVRAVNPGFRPEHVLTMHVTFAPSASAGSAQVLNELTLARVRALPGVQAAGAIHELFSAAVVDNFGLRRIEGRAPESRRQWTPLAWTTIRGDYFQAMGTRLLSGRFFSVSDTADSPLVAVINEAVARRYWPGENAIGKRFKGFDRRGKNDDWLTVIGVVEDMHSNGLDRQPAGQIYQWYRQNQEGTPDLVVRARGNPSAVAGALRKTVRSVDAAAVISKVSTVEQQLAGQLSSRRFEAFLVTLFSALALLLAGTGVYGIIQYGVSRRISEIGIRMALGAMPADIQRLVISEGLSVGIIGMALGAAGALVLTRFLSSLLFGVRPSDPLTFTGASVLLFSVAALASSMPARRASRIDPMVALRYE